MKKEDLKTGMIVETRCGERYIVIKNVNIENKEYDICLNESGWLDLDCQNNELGKRYLNVYDKMNECFDIVKVYNVNNCNLVISKNMDCCLNLIWESEELKPQLTERERAYLKAYSYDYEWVARDEDTTLCCFSNKPVRNGSIWVRNQYKGLCKKIAYPDPECLNFQFIKWEDEEPYKISELLGDEDKNR